MACKRLDPFFSLSVVAAGILACGSGSSPGMPDGRTPGDGAVSGNSVDGPANVAAGSADSPPRVPVEDREMGPHRATSRSCRRTVDAGQRHRC